MRQTTQRVALFAMILSLVLSGCLRSANSADLPDVAGQPPGESTQEPAAVAQVVTEMPEVTEAPTEAPPVEMTAEATIEVTESVLPVETETPTAETTAFVLPTETEPPTAEATVFMLPTETEPPTAEATVFMLPTETLLPTQTTMPTATPTPTLTPAGEEVFPAQEPVPTEGNETPAVDVPAVAQNQEVTPVPPLQQTATALIQEATDTAEALTATAIGPTVAPATNVPTRQAPAGTQAPTRRVRQTPANAGGAAGSGANCVHQVRAGENLFRISLRYGVSIQDIAVASGIANPNLILVGQRLTIPGCGTTGVVPPPTDPATPAPGAGGTGGSVGGVGGGTVHVVRQYESLFEISMMYGVPISSLAAANGISNINLIIIGDELTIPAS